jgi:hypothetical protein
VSADILLDASHISFRSVSTIEFDVCLLLHRLVLRVLGCLLTQEMIGFAVQVLLGFLFLAAIALLTTKEIVILTAAADPAAIRKIKLIFATRVLFLIFRVIRGSANLFAFNFNKIDFVNSSHFLR